MTEKVRVTFLVNVPRNTPPDDIICVVGDHRKLGSWKLPGVPLKKVAPFQYQISFVFKRGVLLNFKFARNSWQTVEKNEEFHECPNRSLYVKKGGVFPYNVKTWADMGTPTPQKERKHTFVGNIKEHSDFYSEQLDNSRTIWVYLPPGYHNKRRKRYPVLYAHDGNNVFDRATAFLGVEWELDDTSEKLIRESRMREIMIVAVQNTVHREDEYTHSYMPEFAAGGKADLYIDFIINKVKPFIDSNYRTLTDRQYTAVMGSSLGGLLSLYMVWKYSHVFSMAAVVSPSIWWNHRDILDIIEATPDKPPVKIWLDIGTLEGYCEGEGISYAVRDVRDLRNLLLRKKFRIHYDLEYMEIGGGEHNEAAWAKRVDKILLFFFGSKRSAWKKKWKLGY